jgi:hypothetical protein
MMQHYSDLIKPVKERDHTVLVSHWVDGSLRQKRLEFQIVVIQKRAFENCARGEISFQGLQRRILLAHLCGP